MSKPVLRVMPFSVGDSPTVIWRRKRSLVSRTRRHVIVSGSTSNLTNLMRQQEQAARRWRMHPILI